MFYWPFSSIIRILFSFYTKVFLNKGFIILLILKLEGELVKFIEYKILRK